MTHVLQNVVFPARDDAEVRGLYVRGAAAEIVGRTELRIAPDATVSFGTYFNAFPASYWQHWTTVGPITLHLQVEGAATVRVFHSDAAGAVTADDEVPVIDDLVHHTFALDGFDDGGWVWFEVTTGARGVTIRDGAWSTDAAPVRPPRSTIGITTFNKPDYCVATLAVLAADDALRPYLGRVFVIDQGDRLVQDEPGFAEASAALGDSLALVRQPNLGGSGGYARAMAETLAIEDAQFILLMDDDVQIEAESIRRAILFGAYCLTPTLVGGHMIDLLERTRLYAWAEVVDRPPFMWRPIDEERTRIDLDVTDLRDAPMLHERAHADYNGWWMCLIPRAALEKVGLPLPAFIKWDDAEYGLRAAERGVPTVSLPGAALWHISWAGKDDQIDWQAYFHARNRIVAALLHSDEPGGGTLLRHSRRVDIKHVLAMQYYPVALRHRALRAILAGPGHMHRDLRAAMPAARALAQDYFESPPNSPGFAENRVDWPADDSDIPTGMRMRAFLIRALASNWLRRPRRSARQSPEVVLHANRARWWRLAHFDSALVEMAGSGDVIFYARDRARYRRLMGDSIRLHRDLQRRWSELRTAYRSADITSLAAWTTTFENADRSRDGSSSSRQRSRGSDALPG